MAFYCGFFNSINKDRLYTAEDMNMPYKRIVSNGVFAKKNGESSTDFQVTANGSMNITVQPGNGIFKDKWAELTQAQIITLATAHTLLNRIDSVIVRMDNTDDVRGGSIIVRSGDYGETPTPPSLVNTDDIKEYRLANITVGANVEEIGQDVIEDTRPTDECGWVHNLLWDSDITATYKQWQAQFDNWFNKVKDEAKGVTEDIAFYTQEYTTEEADEDELKLDIAEYTSTTDLMTVYLSGLKLNSTEYTFDEDTRIIKFANKLDKGTVIEINVYHKKRAGVYFYSNEYTTTTDDEDTIATGISSYNKATDKLEVYLNGFKLNASEFSYNDTDKTIKTTYKLDKGTTVEFLAFHKES
jgi:hypothetical protein